MASFLDLATGLPALWAKIKGLITQSDWEEDDTTSSAYVLNRPAIRVGEGENSVVVGQTEQITDAKIYTLYITGEANATTFTYTTEDTLPTLLIYLMNGYAVYDGSIYNKIVNIDSSTVTFATKYSKNQLTNIPILVYCKYHTANGKNNCAEGTSSTGKAAQAHAEGSESFAGGLCSHAENGYTAALASHSHAEGSRTIAASNYQHVQGKYNIVDTEEVYADIVGNGATASTRSNAYTLDWSGNGWFAGKVSAGTVAAPANPTAANDLATKAYVDSATSGITTNLAGLTDTTIASPSDGQVLTYDSSTSQWVNADPTGSTYSLSLSGSTITLTGSDGSTSSINLPIYDGSVTEVWTGGTY